jgi:hypothetical protein
MKTGFVLQSSLFLEVLGKLSTLRWNSGTLELWNSVLGLGPGVVWSYAVDILRLRTNFDFLLYCSVMAHKIVNHHHARR